MPKTPKPSFTLRESRNEAEREAALAAFEETLAELVRSMAWGDEIALTRLFELTAARVYAVAYRVVRNAEMADEVVSDVYFQAWRQSSNYDRKRGRVLTWLLMICHSRAVDALRKLDDTVAHPAPHELVNEAELFNSESTRDFLSILQESSAIYQALVKLTPIQQQLIMLAFFYGYTHTEIQAQLGMPLGTIKSHIRQALKKLNQTLRREHAAELQALGLRLPPSKER